MIKPLLVALLFTLPATGICAEPAGEIVSLSCSQAIASAIKYIERENLNIDLSVEDGKFVCVGPTGGRIVLRIQTPGMDAATKKHYFNVDPETYDVVRHAYSR